MVRPLLVAGALVVLVPLASPLAAQSRSSVRVPLDIVFRVLVGAARARRSASSGGSAPSSGGGAATSATAKRVLATADRYLGVPYKWGGTTPSGFDCSGFVRYVFARHDVALPRTSREQARAGKAMPARWSALAAGDLVMFAEPGERISHVAIYAGGGRIIHSSSSGHGVRYDDLDSRRGAWFAKRIVAARRVMADGRSLVRDLERALAGDATLDPPDGAPPP